jgi:glycosyltransferase involved in cell wall biosynthesis
MRVGVDGHVLTGKFQGTRTTLANLLRAVIKKNEDHEMVVYSDDPVEAAKAIGATGIQHAALRARSALARIFLDFPMLFQRDQIHVGVFNYVAPPLGRNILFIHDVLTMSHSQLFPRAFALRKWISGFSMLRAWRVVVVSDYTAKMIRELYPSSIANKLRVIKNGPSFPLLAYFSGGDRKGGEYILAVGRLEKRKNIELLAQAFLSGAPSHVSLVVVGSLDLGYEYRLPLDNRITRIEKIDDMGLIELYRNASLFVYPSSAEGFGLPLLDALLFGVPTISSDRTAMPEVGGDLPEWFDPDAPGSVEWLADRIARHFADGPVPAPSLDERQALGERLSWDRAAEAFLAVIDELQKSAETGSPDRSRREQSQDIDPAMTFQTRSN